MGLITPINAFDYVVPYIPSIDLYFIQIYIIMVYHEDLLIGRMEPYIPVSGYNL